MAGSFQTRSRLTLLAAQAPVLAALKCDEYGGKAIELPATQALFSDYAVQHQPLVEAIYDNEPVDDVANRNAVGRMHQRNYIAIHVRGEPAVNKR